jgi:hypothetical protein
LRLDNHGYSPQTLQAIAEAAARFASFADAAAALQLAGIAISARHVERLADAIGRELAQQRDQKVVQRRRRQLPARVAAPAVAVVEVDGGRLRTREAGAGPGVHQPQSKENKIACFIDRPCQVQAVDPQPEPPASFLLPRRVQRLVQRIKGQAGEVPAEAEAEQTHSATEALGERLATTARVRTCVATMQDSQAFGPMVAAEAQERNFYAASQRAFVADGAAYNWTIQQGYFRDFEPITDFLHVLCYVYLAAVAVSTTEAAGWQQYVTWLTACWQGRVAEVIAALQSWQQRLGVAASDGEGGDDPRRWIAEALSYLRNNQERMDYPRYRQQGLPVTSSLVESLVGEFNARVKERKKFWNRPHGPEPILQLRAAILSQDGRLQRYFSQRPGNPYRRRKAA